MKVYELIEREQAAGLWRPLVAACDWAFNKDVQYTLYQLVRQLEPGRLYGYRERIVSYIADNKVVTGGVFDFGRSN